MATRLISCVFFLFALCSLSQAGQATVESRIISVTVYPDSAYITRNAQIQLEAGKHTLLFDNIIPEINENTLKVSIGRDSQLTILGARVKKEFLQEVPVEKVKALKEQIQSLEDNLNSINNGKNVLAEEKKFLDSVRLFSEGQIPKDLVTKIPQVTELEQLLKFLDNKYRDNSSQVMDSELRIRDIHRQLEVAKRELAQISGPAKKLKRSIEIEVETANGGSHALAVSYLVLGAGWQPVYDARADFEKSEVELVSYGLLKQSTGEDWKDVEVALSTARPAMGGRMPEVVPWFLRPLEYRHYEVNKSMMMDMQREAKEEVLGGVKSKGMNSVPMAPAEAVVADKGIAVTYTIPYKTTVDSNGLDNKLRISAQTLKAAFEYSSYPRILASAFLGSKVTNADNLQLLGGKVNIFLSGDFVGNSYIDNIGPGEEFELFLGQDDNVKVKRELLEKKVDQTILGNLPSPNKKTGFKYKLSVENYKRKKINMKLYEAMPVSEDDRIKVKLGNISVEPKKKDWEDKKGVWLFEFDIEPGKKQEINYSFNVEHPRNMELEGF